MLERGMQPDFSDAARAQLGTLSQSAPAAGAAVVDLRDRLWASIDNDDSRDLDQLSVEEAHAGAAVRVMLAIADVDALVQRGSPIDRDAAANTTSVYTVAETFPMLPEKLSTDLTSLTQDQDRLAICIDMTLSLIHI